MSSSDPAKPETVLRHRLRMAGRCGVLIAAVVLAWPMRGDSFSPAILPALSPFAGVSSALATRTLSLVACLGLPVFLLALFFPRWFCRHACPTGLLQEVVQRFRPAPVNSLRPKWTIGVWLVAITVSGACFGYPFFLWLDPLALFNGFLNAWRMPLVAANFVAGFGLPILLLLVLGYPRTWCHRICPLGATQDLLAWPQRRLCQARHSEPGGTQPARKFVTRRLFLGGCAGATGALLLPNSETSPTVLRPPGALPENSFTGVCLRCGNCARSCPSRIIEPDFGASGLAGLLTPKLRFDLDYCRENCHRCGQVCPSGAIARLSLEGKRRRIIGPAVVNLDICWLANGRECTACMKNCSTQAIALRSPDGGFVNEPQVDFSKCNGCGACETVCPVRPERAIRVVAQPGRLAAI